MRLWRTFPEQTVDNNEVKTFLAGTINNHGCGSFPGNIVIDEEIPIMCTLTTLPKEIQEA